MRKPTPLAPRKPASGYSRERRLGAAALAGSAILAGRLRRRIGLPQAVSTACVFVAPVALARGFPRARVRDAAVWAAHMWAYKVAFEVPNDRPEWLRRRVHIDYPIWSDTRLGGGEPPGQRLQRRLRRRGHLSRLDKALTFLYWTWEAEPHLVMAWIRWRRPDRFIPAAARLAAVFDLTLIGYWALPSSPPWWASEQAGRMGGDVRRVMLEVASWVKGKPDPTEGDHEMGANPFAAMPSDHFASAVMTAILLSEEGRAQGACGWSYALLLGFTLVYLGEHYVTDLIAGLLLALAVNRARAPLERMTAALLAPPE